MRKHLICHIHCLDHPNVLRFINLLKCYKYLFDIKIASITNANNKIYKLVEKILVKWGFKVFTVENTKLRETAPFFEVSLPYLLEHASKDDLLYYCHSKGVTYYPNGDTARAVSIWIDTLVKNTLENVDELPFDDEKYGAFGTLTESKNFLPGDLGENFSYVGTYFWIRLNKLFDREFDYAVSKFYLEALVGMVMKEDEGYHLPPRLGGKSPYMLQTWINAGVINE